MDQAEKYQELKKRNEQQLLAIRKLETRIAKARQQVEEKRKTTAHLKKRHEHIKQLTLQQTNYQKVVFDKQQVQLELKAPSLTTGRRDLSKLLALTSEKVCTKLEDLLKSAKTATIPSNELMRIKKLIVRLPDPHNTKQYCDILRQLLLEHEKLKHTPSDKAGSRYDMKDNKKVESILEFLEYRKRKAKELSTRNDQLILECQEAEKSLQQRVESLHKDPAVQHALTKNIRVKAASHQAQTELHCMKSHIEDLTAQIDTIEDQTKNDIFGGNSDVLNSLATQHEGLLQLISTNRACHEKLKSVVKGKEMENTAELIERINSAKKTVIKDIGNAVNQQVKETDSRELLDAKDKMSPFSSISTIQFVKEVLDTMQSISVLEKESVVELCSEIRETLEKLVEKWGSSLSEQDVQVLSTVPAYHDGIDNVIQSIDAIRLHFQEKEELYIKEQEQKLTSKLATADRIEKEVHRTLDAVEERELLTTIGDSFAVSDKSFKEWSETLFK